MPKSAFFCPHLPNREMAFVGGGSFMGPGLFDSGG
jgi:hypothetical protein